MLKATHLTTISIPRAQNAADFSTDEPDNDGNLPVVFLTSSNIGRHRIPPGFVGLVQKLGRHKTVLNEYQSFFGLLESMTAVIPVTDRKFFCRIGQCPLQHGDDYTDVWLKCMFRIVDAVQMFYSGGCKAAEEALIATLEGACRSWTRVHSLEEITDNKDKLMELLVLEQSHMVKSDEKLINLGLEIREFSVVDILRAKRLER